MGWWGIWRGVLEMMLLTLKQFEGGVSGKELQSRYK